MPNPNVPQGTLNRLKASVVWNNFPQLNVTPAFLGKEMIRLGFEGKATTFIPTTTGAVTSPEPYQKITVTIHLLKTQALAPLYKDQLEANSLLGDGTIWPDVQTGQGLSNYQITNCAIEEVREIGFDGADAGWVIMIGGYYLINANLWN